LHRALLGVQTDLDPRLQYHKRIAKILYRLTDIHGASPVYQFQDGAQEGLVAVYSIRTFLDPKELHQKIIEAQGSLKTQRAWIKILVFDDIILRTGEIVIPAAELHTKRHWCLPATDLWGDYIHPIEGKDLRHLSDAIDHSEKIEFYTQSKTLLDFFLGET